MTFAVFHDYPGLQYALPKFHDFPGPVVTLLSNDTEGNIQVKQTYQLRDYNIIMMAAERVLTLMTLSAFDCDSPAFRTMR